MHDYNPIETLGIPDGLQADGDSCPACGEGAVERCCVDCGVSGWVIDCGHYAQPRPLSAGREDGSAGHKTFCLDCAQSDDGTDEDDEA
jgi:hypothetical protein